MYVLQPKPGANTQATDKVINEVELLYIGIDNLLSGEGLLGLLKRKGPVCVCMW